MGVLRIQFYQYDPILILGADLVNIWNYADWSPAVPAGRSSSESDRPSSCRGGQNRALCSPQHWRFSFKN